MHETGQLIVFLLDGQRFGLELAVVERIIPAVEITPLPHAPDHLSGLINVKGENVPVLNLRRLLDLPERQVAARDKMVIARRQERTVAWVIDEITGFADSAAALLPENGSPPAGSGIISGTVKDEAGIILICDPDLLLLPDEAGVATSIRG